MNDARGPSSVIQLAAQLARVGLSAASFGGPDDVPQTLGGTVPQRPLPANESKIGLVAV